MATVGTSASANTWQLSWANTKMRLYMVQAGNSLHGPVQTVGGPPLPPSPVYKASCDHFTWPLLEPQVLSCTQSSAFIMLHSSSAACHV